MGEVHFHITTVPLRDVESAARRLALAYDGYVESAMAADDAGLDRIVIVCPADTAADLREHLAADSDIVKVREVHGANGEYD